MNKNELFFFLGLDQSETRYVPFVPITEGDQDFVDIINETKAQQFPEHSYTQEDAVFEIFKIDYHPSSIQDFEDAKLLQTRKIKNAESHVFKDKVEYGKDYYYLFRALNSFKFPGNPTQVMKVRLEQGVEKNLCFFEFVPFEQKTEEYNVFKNFDRIFHIYPNSDQTIMTNLEEIEGPSYKGKLDEVEVGLCGTKSLNLE